MTELASAQIDENPILGRNMRFKSTGTYHVAAVRSVRLRFVDRLDDGFLPGLPCRVRVPHVFKDGVEPLEDERLLRAVDFCAALPCMAEWATGALQCAVCELPG